MSEIEDDTFENRRCSDCVYAKASPLDDPCWDCLHSAEFKPRFIPKREKGKEDE